MASRIRTGLLGLAIGLFVLLAFLFYALPAIVETSANGLTRAPLSAPSDSARYLHETIWIADLHADALLWNRDLLQRARRGHVDIPRLIEGNVALQAFSIVSKTPFGLNFESNDDKTDMITALAIFQRWPIATWFSLKERALFQAEKLFEFAARSQGKFSIITSKKELEIYIALREKTPGITAGFLGIEGAQVLEGKLDNLNMLFAAGFRMMSPSHFFDTEVGGSAHGIQKGGLTDFGRLVIQKMEELGMIVDLAHASPQTIDDVLEIATRPVVVSHTGVRGVCNTVRNLSDKHLKAIAAAGGIIGMAYFDGATCGQNIDAIVKTIRYAVNVVGPEHVALGSDFDGAVTTPFDAAGMVYLTDALLKAGFSRPEIKLIIGENVRRILLQLLPE